MQKTRKYTQNLLTGLEAQGIKLASSKFFDGVFYKPDSQGLTVYTERNGELQVDWKNIDDLIEELMDFQEAYGT